MDCVLAIDSGTTGTRAMVFDIHGKVLAKSYQEIKRSFPREGWVEQDAGHIRDTAIQCIAEVTRQVPRANWAGAGITNQRETVVAWDRTSGEPLGPAVVWQCRRTSKWCRENAGETPWIKQKTGLLIDPYFSATKMAWMLKNVPGLARENSRGNLCMGTVDAWLLYCLTNGKSFKTEPSNASRTMLYNLEKNNWDTELLDFFGMDQGSLPEIVPTLHHFGTIENPRLKAEIPILAILGDQQASLFGHGGWREGVAKCTYGTGLFLMCRAPEKLHILDNLITTVGWQSGEKILWAYEGALFSGGSCIQWLRDGMKIIEKASQTEGLSAELPDNGNIYFSPALSGLGAPHWDPDARGAFIGLSQSTGRAHLARAVLESLAYQVREVVDEFKKHQPLESLKADGGATANSFLMQFQADLLQIPIHVASQPEATALGAGAAAAMMAGWFGPQEAGNWNPTGRVYEPSENGGDDESWFAKWKTAVDRSRSWVN